MRFRPLAWACCLLAVFCAGGCVQRRITVRSNPPGALVYVDKHEIGKTPCSVEYIYYGTREIKLIKDGYETLTVMQWIPPAWYQIPPLDFVSENIVPTEIRDERTYTYQLVPARIVPANQLLGRAENLRRATKLENIAATPPSPPPQTLLQQTPPQQTLPPPRPILGPAGSQPVVAPPGYLPGPAPGVYPGSQSNGLPGPSTSIYPGPQYNVPSRPYPQPDYPRP